MCADHSMSFIVSPNFYRRKTFIFGTNDNLELDYDLAAHTTHLPFTVKNERVARNFLIKANVDTREGFFNVL